MIKLTNTPSIMKIKDTRFNRIRKSPCYDASGKFVGIMEDVLGWDIVDFKCNQHKVKEQIKEFLQL